MIPRIFVSHCAVDHELAAQVAEFLRAVLEGARVSESSLPGREPAGDADSLAAIKQELSTAGVVIGIITAHAFDSGEVPFQLGAAWALGKRLVLLLSPDGDAHELYLPMGHAEALVLGPDALLELASSLAGRDSGVELGTHSRRALGVLFPAWGGLDRESSEHPIMPRGNGSAITQQQWPLDDQGEPRPSSPPPPQASDMESGIVPHARPGLPGCGSSLLAGRAVSDCVFNREQGGPFADELDVPFGAFLAALGGNWSVLRELEDLDVWLEAADNVLETLSISEQHVRFWYEIGFQLATLINLAGRELDGGAAPDGDAQELWQGSWAALRISAQHAGLEPAALEEISEMLENLRGPLAVRDYANLARVQERMRELANRRDASGLAASA
jgi:hypothetical protein